MEITTEKDGLATECFNSLFSTSILPQKHDVKKPRTKLFLKEVDM